MTIPCILSSFEQQMVFRAKLLIPVVAPEVNSCIIRRMTEVHCPKYDRKEIKKAGFNTCGVQRYFCRNASCDVNAFMLSYRYKAYNYGVIEQAIDMAINSSGMRDTVRVLGISSRNTINKALKKRRNHC